MRAELTIEIARTPEDVFAYLADVSNLPAWQSGVSSAELVGGAESKPGARMIESRNLLGMELRTTLEISEYEPPRVLALHALDGPAPFDVRHELEPAGAGTSLRVVVEGEPAFLPGFASGLVARRLERQVRKDFELLRLLLEARA
jgi:carbon monoxide dehydrogenase subunit G